MKLNTTHLVAGLTAIALAGCGAEDTADTKPISPSGAPIVTVTARDYAFDDVPRTITAGTPIAITNTSAAEAHELTAFRLPDTETRTLADLKALPPEELGPLLPGAPALAIYAAPKSPGQLIIGNGSLQEPGRYLFVCFIPIGAKPDDVLTAMKNAAANPNAGPPQIDGGPPHFTAGMITEVTVK